MEKKVIDFRYVECAEIENRIKEVTELKILSIHAYQTQTKKVGNKAQNIDKNIDLYIGVNKDARPNQGISILIHQSLKRDIVSWKSIMKGLYNLILTIRIVILGVQDPNENFTVCQKCNLYYSISDL